MSLYDELEVPVRPDCECRCAPRCTWTRSRKVAPHPPAGSHGLKAVTKAAQVQPGGGGPRGHASFCAETAADDGGVLVSDAVSTYDLHMKYVPVHLLAATIIPMSPDEVLRKGSHARGAADGTGVPGNIVCLNKTQSMGEKHYKGHLLESETYIGGHVECLDGVFRATSPPFLPKGYRNAGLAVDDFRDALRTRARAWSRATAPTTPRRARPSSRRVRSTTPTSRRRLDLPPGRRRDTRTSS